MIKWPTRAKAAIRSLFIPLQDIEVYVEDENDEVFYRALLKRVVEPNIKVARVLSLGNRDAVIAAATHHDYTAKPALFIIDGDLEWVRNLPKPAAKGLHRHNAYCVENLLICSRAVTSLLAQDAVLSEDAAAESLNFVDWQKSFDEPLTDLFAAYATAQEFCPQLKTVSIGVGVMCTQSKKGKKSTLATAKVNQHIAHTLAEVEKIVGKPRTTAYFKKTQERIRALPFPIDAISGKDFIFPLLGFHLKSLGSSVNRRSLKVRLAAMCADDRLRDLRIAVNQASLKWP